MSYIKFDKNEKKNVWIQVEERDDESFTIASATFQVFDSDGTSVQASASATVSTDKIYGLVDTTASGFTAGESYEVVFTYIIDSETYIDKVHIKLEEKKI